MATAPLVSCIVPTYNGAAYVREALDSILCQSYPRFEVVAVDDGSTDGTVSILESYGERVRIVRQPNAGPAAARNTGIRESKGDLLAFLDQDDRWHPEKLMRQVPAVQERADASVAWVESFWPPSDAVTGGGRFADQPRSGAVPGYVTGTLLARREVFTRVGGFQPEYRYADSLDWFARAAELGVVVELLPDVLLFHRVHDANLSRRGSESRAECARILKRALDRRRPGARP